MNIPTPIVVASLTAASAAIGALWRRSNVWMDRWALEVAESARRALEEPPTYVGEKTTIKPPSFPEPPAVRQTRQAIERRVIVENVRLRSDPPPTMTRYRMRSRPDG